MPAIMQLMKDYSQVPTFLMILVDCVKKVNMWIVKTF